MELEQTANFDKKINMRKNLDITKFRFYTPSEKLLDSKSQKKNRCFSNNSLDTTNDNYKRKKEISNNKHNKNVKVNKYIIEKIKVDSKTKTNSLVNNSLYLNNNYKPSLNIIKTIKEENRMKGKKIKTTNNMNTYNSFDSYSNSNNYINTIEIIPNHNDHNLLNLYLKQKYFDKQKNKKWYTNYKHDSNENSMLDIQNEDIFIPSDKAVCLNRDKEIMFENLIQLKSCISNLAINDQNFNNKKIKIFENPYYELFN